MCFQESFVIDRVCGWSSPVSCEMRIACQFPECVPRHIIYFLADGGLYGPRGRLRRGGHGTKTGRDQRCAKACNGDEHSKRPAASAAVQAKVIVSVQVSLCSTNRRINKNCLFGKAYTQINNCKVPYEAFMVKLLCYPATHENQFIHLASRRNDEEHAAECSFGLGKCRWETRPVTIR